MYVEMNDQTYWRTVRNVIWLTLAQGADNQQAAVSVESIALPTIAAPISKHSSPLQQEIFQDNGVRSRSPSPNFGNGSSNNRLKPSPIDATMASMSSLVMT